jgi:hypothetical protein
MMKHPRTFGQRLSLAVPDTVDDPLPDTEIDAWIAKSIGREHSTNLTLPDDFRYSK